MGLIDTPTVADPLCGLTFLRPLALIGRQTILDLAAVPADYVWQDIAVAGTIVLLAGAPGDGKTTLLFLLLAARANTGDAKQLLTRTVRPARAGAFVVLIEAEHGESSTARKLVKSVRLLDLDDAALGRVIVVARRAVQLCSPEWQDVVRLIAAGLVSDVAVDTVARVAPADANDERAQVAVFHELANAIEQAPTAGDKPIIWAVAHMRKNGNGGGDLADVSGSVQRTGQADSVLLCKGDRVNGRTVGTTVTFAKLREDPDEWPLPVRFEVVAGVAGASVLRTTCAGAAVDDKRPLEDQILDQLASGPKTKSALSRTLRRGEPAIDEALTALFALKVICTQTQVVKGRPRKAFALRVASTTNGAHASEGSPRWSD